MRYCGIKAKGDTLNSAMYQCSLEFKVCQPVIDIPRSQAYNIIWEAMEGLVDTAESKNIGMDNFSCF